MTTAHEKTNWDSGPNINQDPIKQQQKIEVDSTEKYKFKIFHQLPF